MKDFQQLMQPDSPFFVIFIVLSLGIIVFGIVVTKLITQSSQIKSLENIVNAIKEQLDEQISESSAKYIQESGVSHKRISELSSLIAKLQAQTTMTRDILIQYLEARIKVTKQNQKHGEPTETTGDNSSTSTVNSKSNQDNY